MGTIPQSMVQDLLDRADLSSRRKAIRVLRRLARDREQNIHTAVEEIETDLTRLKPVSSFPTAQLLIVDIIDAQRLLTNLGQPMAETRMKQILFKNNKCSIFDSVTTEIDRHHGWSFARSRKEFDDCACRWKIRNLDEPPASVLEKRNRVEDMIPFSVMDTNAIYDSSSVNPRPCFNCNNMGHRASECVAPFCGKCRTTWPIGHIQIHGCNNCPIVSIASRGRGGRSGAVGGRAITPTGFGGRGRGGRAVALYQPALPVARVNSMISEVDLLLKKFMSQTPSSKILRLGKLPMSLKSLIHLFMGIYQ